MGRCAHLLLTSGDPRVSISAALTGMVEAANVCAGAVYEVDDLAERRFSEMGLATRSDLPEGARIRFPERLELVASLRCVIEELREGNVVACRRFGFVASEKTLLQVFRAASAILIPLGWQGAWRGFLVLADARRGRDWGNDEIALLLSAAEMIGACVERSRADADLRARYVALETRITERTQELEAANLKLRRENAKRRALETAKAKLDAQLRQAEKLNALGTLAGGIAHDFNNILVTILGSAEMALLKSEDAELRDRHVGQVLQAAQRAKELVRQILAYSHHDECPGMPFAVAPILEEAASQVQASLPPNVLMRVSSDSGISEVSGNPIQLHQVVLNLCTNAAQALQECGGIVEIIARSVRVEAEYPLLHRTLQPGRYALIRVSDNGAGIPPHILDRVFEPFFTTKALSAGTGMGLAIVHSIIDRMGGGIGVHTQVGVGTVFEVFLPEVHDATAVEVPEAPPLPACGSERILLLDDEEPLVQLWTGVLEDYGYGVTGFTSASEAKAAYEAAPETYDCVITDQHLLDGTGIEFAREALSTRPELPVVIVTGFTDSVEIEEARAAGVFDVVFKPLLAHELSIVVRRAIDQTAAQELG